MIIGIDARPLILKNPTGIATYLINVLQYIGKHDKNNKYILYTSKPFECERNFGPNFEVKYIYSRIGTFWLRYRIPRIIKKDKVDIFWGPSHILPLKVKGIKYVLTVHDLALLINPAWGEKNNSKIQNFYLPRSIRDADYILTDSESTKKDIKKICKNIEHHIECIYLGGSDLGVDSNINEKEIELVKQKFGIKKKYFIFVGTIEPRKNIISLVHAFESLQEDCQLVLVGGLGWRYKEILKVIDESPLRENIIMTGYVKKEEKIALLKSAEAFVYLSHYEGFGIPILEAMETETLILSASNSSLPEVGGNAVLYVRDENNCEEIVNAMKRVLNINKEEKKDFILKEISNLKKFSWEKCGKETMNAILGESIK